MLSDPVAATLTVKPPATAKPAASSAPPQANDAKPPAAKPKAKANAKMKKAGRSAGTSNYSGEDLESLVAIIEEILPIGSPSWDEIGHRFAAWAAENNRPVRDASALKCKYAKLIGGKPTGVGGFSEIQLRYRNVEKRTHLSVGGLVLNDGDDVEDSSEGEGEGEDEDQNLSATAVEDAIMEIDGVQTARATEHFSHTPLSIF